MRPVVFCQRKQRNEGYGDKREGKGARRISLAPPSLHSVQYSLIVHCHDFIMRKRRDGVIWMNAPALVREQWRELCVLEYAQVF
jgi:hypothetical protein